VATIFDHPRDPRETAQVVDAFGWAEHATALDRIYSQIIAQGG
jgi:hypothetical protein